MWRRAWKPAAAFTCVSAGTSYLYYTYKRPLVEIPVSVRGADGKREMTNKSFPLLVMSDVDARLREHVQDHTEARPNGLTWKHTTAFLPSNDPIEDANSHQIIQRDESDPAGPGDYLFFAVMDGHGGYDTSRLLSRTLIKAVALELSSLSSDPNNQSSGILQSLKSIIKAPAQALASRDDDPKQVSSAIQRAFVNFDSELLKAAPRVLAVNWDEDSRKKQIVPDLSKHPLALQTMLPAISGSCALMAVFDTAHRDLYIACTGDSRAVAGVWEPTTDGKGVWRVDVLSEDQTGRNPSELKRIRSEHPKDEEADVVRKGRILGGLEPSRAFGDARYKWTGDLQALLNQAFMVGNGMPMRNYPAALKTPPYVTAQPVVTHRKLSFEPSAPEGSLRFLVLATDGLWDALSSDDVVRLVGGHLAGLKGNIPKSTLPSLVPTSEGAPTVEGKDKRREQGDGAWAFVDDKVSTHLIRNALGGGDELALRRLVTIPAPYSRRYRDDITVTVVTWEVGNEKSAQISSFTEKAVKAKL